MSMSPAEIEARKTVVGRTLRDFSAAGPCIVEGVITREAGGKLYFTNRNGVEAAIGTYGNRWKSGLLHVEPCPSCRDHAKTSYPNGYTD